LGCSKCVLLLLCCSQLLNCEMTRSLEQLKKKVKLLHLFIETFVLLLMQQSEILQIHNTIHVCDLLSKNQSVYQIRAH